MKYYLTTLLILVSAAIGSAADEPDFARDVRPILATHCLKCHGPDDVKRQGKLRLDSREAAILPAESGEKAIVPGDLAASELIKRIFTSDESTLMPPPDAKLPLTAEKKETLKKWIAAGAKYKPHWAFQSPQRPALPTVKNTAWPKNPIDAFVLAKLEAAGLEPAKQADKATLVRRVYLDLIGLPPSPEEAAEFLSDTTPQAYEKLVDKLLQSPHYGERWARRWLDLARYADTNGYEKDRPRTMWPYRDWVINALNHDMPFDQFTIEQLAGDQLPNATTSQIIATGLHRNTMINEEGGIDPQEFRFYSLVDRVNTTGTIWLGLTMTCVQCHTHKYDPIPQQDYYQLMAFLNNADEPEYELPDEKLAARRRELEDQIAGLEKSLADKFPLAGPVEFKVAKLDKVTSANGAEAEVLADHSVRFAGKNPETDTYTLNFTADAGTFSQLKIEVLNDPSLPSEGPGRTPHGNFVLSEVQATFALAATPEKTETVKLATATADFSQNNFSAAEAIDGKPNTGWAISGEGKWNVARTLTLQFASPVTVAAGTMWTVKLDQQHGKQHTIGRAKLSLGQATMFVNGLTAEETRRNKRDERFAEWLKTEQSQTIPWTQLVPTEADANLPILTIQNDGSVLASSDQSKADLYTLKFRSELKGLTAIRIEAMPDDRLPRRGPGRVYYEGPPGDFTLSDLKLFASGKEQKIAAATHSFAAGGNTAAAAIDDNKQTGWSINGGQGKTHFAVFKFAEPIADARDLRLELLFEKYYAAGLGRFRVWGTTSTEGVAARDFPVALEPLLKKSPDQLTPAERGQLLLQFALTVPEYTAEREAINKLRQQIPQFTRTLVMAERPAHEPRTTFVHKRGEFLQPTKKVSAELLSLFPPLPKDVPRDRLSFARWLASEKNPLVGRVTMNRHWQAFFGRGLVKTTEDFGYQGELPSHPELLDWLAVELPAQKWSLKRMQKLIVMSATYQQSADVLPDVLAKDPENRLLARFPRQRLEAELVRDNFLKASGLLSAKLGGPSVFPPQPASVSTEGAYGQLNWTVSSGEDRYRRGLYTFAKRTAPYAMFQSFDGPSGEACVARREVSTTPLQALMLLNDEVFVETARALGKRIAARAGSVDDKLTYLFQCCVTRSPTAEELLLLKRFHAAQQQRFENKELDAAAIAGPGEGDPRERSVWALVARAVMNLDEAIVRP